MLRSLGTRIQRHFLVRGLWTGPFLLVFGFYGVKFLWLWLHPAVTVATGLVVMGGILVFPAAAVLTGAGIAAARRDEPRQWVSMALGAAVSTVAIVLTVLAAMGVMEVLAAALN